MGSVLQREEMDSIAELFAARVFDFAQQVVYFPIRHHSPACSYHLLQTIAAYQPQIILIEGPDNSNPIIDVLSHEDTKPPVSIYYAYSVEQHNYSCYFPLLAYSPEYVAMKEARRLGIPARFIDLGYGSRLESLEHGHDIKRENEKVSYQDEKLLTSSAFIKRLCEAMRCRNFDELWERVFEIGGIRKPTDAFVREVFTYCYLSRQCYAEETLAAEGHLIREAHMKMRIAEAREKYGKILVVTGGFHTYGLIEERSHPYQVKQVKDEKVYPMVYTFREADQLSGYASGMPYVNYYDTVWKAIRKKEQEPFHRSAVSFLAQLLKSLRAKGETVSVADAIEGFNLIKGLAVLRDKAEGGAYELLDGVTTAFTKGERSIATERPIETLAELMMGDVIGEIAKNDLDVPIVRDFKEICKKQKLQLKTTGKSQKVLELYAKESHRQTSQFFHCLQFMEVEFCQKESGPDWKNYRNVNLVRESWNYSYSSYVEARLIENSLYGGTIKEAAINRLEEVVKQLPLHKSQEAARWLLQAILMGLEETGAKLFALVEDSVKHDGSFTSLCQTLKTLSILNDQKRLFVLRETERLAQLIDEAYYNAVTKIYELTRPNPEELTEIAEHLKYLHTLAGKGEESRADEIFADQLRDLLAHDQLPAQLEGVVTAILCDRGELAQEEIARRARGYIFGTPDRMLATAQYLQGVFTVARDIFLYDERLIADLNQLVESLSHEAFLQVVPELRLAFTYFTPMEISLIAEKVAALFQTSVEEIVRPAIDGQTLRQARELDQAIQKEFAKWSLM
ncbi:DUF5682 family protein [Brevibacillus fluminis]|uniref:DUF5682 family protein n=1 Tax=Brevibacillus fluminis TaxID=511487 RepID=UPI003F8A7701